MIDQGQTEAREQHAPGMVGSLPADNFHVPCGICSQLVC